MKFQVWSATTYGDQIIEPTERHMEIGLELHAFEVFTAVDKLKKRTKRPKIRKPT
jgi:hypothetical protein